MPCTEGCGSCCDPVFLPQRMAEQVFGHPMGPLLERQSADVEFIVTHWAPYAVWGDGVALQCTEYDVATRRCLAYDSRPPVCRDYPVYRGDTNPDRLVCGYQAELGRTVLPIVEVRHGQDHAA